MDIDKIFQLKGKIAVVTGGYGHLGAAIVDALYTAGAKVVVLGRSVEKFNERFHQYDNNSLFFETTDITDSTQIDGAFDRIVDRHKQIDILFNNAAFVKGRDPEQMTDEEWDVSLNGVLSSVFKCIRRVIPIMKGQGSGKIINISSMYGVVSPDFRLYENGFENFRNPPHYGAAKAAIIQLTKYYASYLGANNIQVNTLTPGPFPKAKIQEEHPAFIERLKERNPLKKIGQPTDLQGVAILLSSKASDFITGQNFIIDGGWTAW